MARHGFRGDGDGPGGDDSGEAGDTGEEPWLLCREARAIFFEPQMHISIQSATVTAQNRNR